MSDEAAKRLDRVRVLFGQNRWSMAADVLREHLAADPGDAVGRAMNACASLYVQPARYGVARDEANEALRLAPRNAYCYFVRALVAVRTDIRLPAGAPSVEAKEQLHLRLLHGRDLARQALAISPDYLHAWHLLTRIASDLRDYVGMLSLADQSLKIMPNDVESLTLRAQALLSLRLWPEALRAVNEGLRVAPDSPVLHALAGSALLELNDRHNAVRALRESLRGDPTNAVAARLYRRATGQPADGPRAWSAAVVVVVAGAYLLLLASCVVVRSDVAAGCLLGLGATVLVAASILTIRDRVRTHRHRRLVASPQRGP